MATHLRDQMKKEDEELSNGNSIPLVAVSRGDRVGAGAPGAVPPHHHQHARSRYCSDSGDSRRSSVYENQCGIALWRPRCLQRFNNPQCLLFVFSLYAMSLGFVVNGINNVNTTAMERRFNLSSASIGMVSSAYDVAAAFLGVAISYLGTGRYKARMVGIAVLVSAAGSVLMALPHFTTGLYSLGEDSLTTLCVPANASRAVSSVQEVEECVTGEGALSRYWYVFLLGQMLHGVGGTTIYTVGVALIDDSVRPSSTPLYLGVLYGSAVLGPGTGYVVGGQFLSYYVDFDVVDTKLTQDDPRWVGAWWLGFVVAAIVNLLVALPVLCFGAELPSARHIRQTRVSQAHAHRPPGLAEEFPKKRKSSTSAGSSSGGEGESPERSVSHFLRSSLSLVRNPCFLFITLSMVTEGVSMSGVATFMPKMIENKFRVSASSAAMLSGLAVVPSAVTGQLLGGVVAQRLKLTIPGLIKLCIMGMVLTLLTLAIVWIDCGQEHILGVTSPYPTSASHEVEHYSLVSACNAACHCDTDVFRRVCDDNSTVFFSPCHAGCTTLAAPGVYSNCSCLAGGGGVSLAGGNRTVHTSGCRESCDILYPFLVLLFLLIGFSMIPVAPGDSIQLRCVPEEIKTFAQGLKTLIVRLLGTVVGPIITGRLLDGTCKVWRRGCDGTALSCWLYDTRIMSASAYTGVAVTKVMSITFCLLALWLYVPPLPPPSPPKGGGGGGALTPLALTPPPGHEGDGDK